MEFARRSRKLYAQREAVVDGEPAPDLCAILRALRPRVRRSPSSALARVTALPPSRRTRSHTWRFAHAKLAGFKATKAYSFVTELPKTATGKIQKYVLRGKQSAIARQ